MKLLSSGGKRAAQKVKDRSDISILILHRFIYESSVNHISYKYLNCDWYINCCILLKLICKVVIRLCNRTILKWLKNCTLWVLTYLST